MKRTILLMLSLLVVLSSVAQIKGVAILETVDKEDKINYAIELAVRTHLSKAVSRAPGYQGYDRVNTSEILAEHDFERTGLVNEEQIRKLGEISGADFILVSEVARLDESTIFVTAKIINVETAKEERTEGEMMGTTPYDIQHGCESLANNLLGLEDPSQVKKPQTTYPAETKTKTKETTKPSQSFVRETPTNLINAGIGELISFPDGTSGLVFYMDENGRGLAVSLKEGEEKWDKNRRTNHIEMVEKLDDESTMMSYGLGRSNTQAIINALGEKGSAAYWCSIQGPEWYLPSCGELYLLVSMLKDNPYVNELLNSSGGGKIDGWYWSSTENDNDEAWNISSSGRVSTEEKNESVKVRAIRTFTK